MPLKQRFVFKLKEIWRYRIAYLFITPFMFCFFFFVMLPVVIAFVLAFTYFNALEWPRFVGWTNFQYLISQDLIFLKYAIPNTFKFALFVGPGGYALSFFLAWLISILPQRMRVWYTLAIYAPSLTGGVAMTIVWLPLLSSDRIGYLNSFLLKLGIINEPVLWVTDKQYLMTMMIIVTLWSSMGVGFLAMLAGLQNVNPELYDAGKIDGIKSRLEEIWYITIPCMKPQMLFGAVMSIVGTFKAGSIGTQLSGQNPTPQYSGHMITNVIDDYGFTRFELGYATAVSVFLLLLMYVANKFVHRILGTGEDE